MKEDARNMNDQPDRFELFTMEDGEEKVTMEYDSRIPNTAIFHFAREDHTLGNLLAAALLQTDHVLFAAYKVPHPLFPHFILRVSTSPETGPREALENACRRVIQDLQNMAKQFTREWEIWKLTNEAAAGREDEEKIEREKKMAEARKQRDRVRAEMIREEEAERVLRGHVGLGRAAWGNDDGGGGGDNGEASPQWGGGNDSRSDGEVSPQWGGGFSPNSTNDSGRAPWGEPSGSSPPWNSNSYGSDARSPSYEPPGSGEASWGAPAGGRSPTYEPPGSGRNQSYQSGQASSSSRTQWGEPSSVASWSQPAASSSRAQWDESEQAAGSASGGASWSEPTRGNDNSYISDLRSPPTSPPHSPPLRPTVSWDAPTGGPQGDRARAASNDTVGGGRGRVAAHELHTFSTSSARSASRGQSNDADDESLNRDPNSEGEQAYLRRAAVGLGTGVPLDVPAGRNESGGSLAQGGENDGNNRSGGEEDSGNLLWGSSGDYENGDSSPRWSGGYGGSSPAREDRMSWEDY